MKINHLKLRRLIEDKKKEIGKFTTLDLYNLIKMKGSKISLETLKAYRKGNIKEPNFDTLKAIASVFKVDVLELIMDNDVLKNHIENKQEKEDLKDNKTQLKECLKTILLCLERMEHLDV